MQAVTHIINSISKREHYQKQQQQHCCWKHSSGKPRSNSDLFSAVYFLLYSDLPALQLNLDPAYHVKHIRGTPEITPFSISQLSHYVRPAHSSCAKRQGKH